MKYKSLLIAAALPLGLTAANINWVGASNGGDGSTWDTTYQNWDTADTDPWNNPATDFAVLGSSNVTLGDQVRMTGFDGSGTLDLGANSLRLGGSGVTSTFSGILNGTGQFVWDSSSILDLSGTNNATGQSVLRSGGTLRLSSADAWQAGTKAKIEAGSGSFTIELAAADEDFNGNLFLNSSSGTARFAAVDAERNMTYDSDNVNFVWGDSGRKMGVLGLGSANSTHTLTLTDNINLNGANRTVDVLNGTAAIGGNISGVISGTGVGLTKTGTGTLKLSAANTYTGDTTITAGAFELASTGSMSFLIGADGVNNKIFDTGAAAITLDGLFVFDTAGASDEFGDSWTIVMSNLETYGTNFDVTGFTEGATGIWTSGIYQFSESTGALSVVPELGTYALLAGCFALASVMIRRRR